jgi:mono/diheme cytochrome c family protein
LLAGFLLPKHAQGVEVEGTPAAEDRQIVADKFNESCAVCHAENLQGTAQGVPLVGRDLKYGDSVSELMDRIGKGSPAKGMPAWENVLDETQIRSLAIYIAEQRQNMKALQFNVDKAIELPKTSLQSEEHSFRVETVNENIDTYSFAIAPLSNGSLLVTEKHKGLSIVSPNGEKTLITGTPKILGDDYSELIYNDLDASNGWMLGVALHPQYKDNGWIYLSYGDICEECKPDETSGMLPSMTKLVRGRIQNNTWVGEEVIWSTLKENYVATSDMMSGGRIGFDSDPGARYIVYMMTVEFPKITPSLE